MNPFRWLTLRSRALLGRRTLERDMKEEIRAHLEQAELRLMARGMSRSEAHNAALREFGNVGSIEETARDARGFRLLESVIADARFAFRYFARKPLTTVTIVLVLALGIGVNTALFSLLQAFMMRPAPGVPKDNAHVRIWAFQQPAKGARWELSEFSYPEVQAFAQRKEAFREVAAWVADEVILQVPQQGMLRGMTAEFVTPNYWRTLGVPVAAGPGFAAQGEGADMSAVMSERLAEELFGDARRALGERVVVNDIEVRIVGIAAPRFEGAVADNGRPQLWLPLSARPEITRASPYWMNETRFSVFARLAPSVTKAQATAVAREVTVRMLPDSIARTGVIRNATVIGLRGAPPLTTSNDDLFGFAAVGTIALLILLVACTNVSSLMVASAVGRRHEIAVRLSLGASRGRVLRQLLTESALLSVTGAALGLLVCYWITTIVSKRENVDIVPDMTTVAATMALAIGTGLLFGLSPALHAIRDGLAGTLKNSGTHASGQSRLQRVFVVSQIVFSQPLLVLIAVMLAIVANEQVTIPMSVKERTIVARFRPIETGAPNQRMQAVDELALRIAGEPAVERVQPEPDAFAVATMAAYYRSGDTTKPVAVLVEGTLPGYFDLMEVPIVLGRDVSLADTNATDYPIVIGTDLVRRAWGTENPVGKRIPATLGWSEGKVDSTHVTIVGVFDDAVATARGKGTRIFTARGQHVRHDGMMIRTRGPASSYLPQLRKFVQANAPAVPVAQLATLLDIDRTNRRQNIQMMAATSAAGGLALLLASIGLFAVIALAVGQRRREIGIRIALGAEPLRVAAMFFRSGLKMSAIGVLIGLPISVLALDIGIKQGLVITTNFFNVPAVGLAVGAVVTVVAAAATWFPARKAATVDPALALKAE